MNFINPMEVRICKFSFHKINKYFIFQLERNIVLTLVRFKMRFFNYLYAKIIVNHYVNNILKILG